MADRILTGLIPTIREALDTVSRELVGLIPAVNKNPDGKNLDRAAVGQSIQWPITTQGALEDIAAGRYPADSGNHEVKYGSMTLSKAKAYPILWTGEQQKSLSNGDKPTINGIMKDEFEQAFRTLTNAIEADLASLFTKASRSTGTAGTLPFGTAGDLSDFAQSLKVLNENGSPSSDLHMVLGNSSAANLRSKQSVLFKVNESGTDNMLRNGALGRVQSFAVGESNQISGHTAGDAAGATTDATGYAIGSTVITLASAGTGAIKAGDTITFAGDSNQYVVQSGDADVSNGGTITIGDPGLRQAIAAGATAITVVADSTEQNLYFDRNAITLQTRMPAVPEGGDGAHDRTTVVDSFSGLAFDISVYKQYKQTKIEVGLVWGFEATNGKHMGVLLS